MLKNVATPGAIFEDLSVELRENLAELCKHRAYKAGQTITNEGDRIDCLGFVTEGAVTMRKLQADGRVNIVGLLVSGHMFGRLFNGPLHYSVVAATDTEICFFPRNEFEALALRSPELERLLLLNILNELDAAREWMLIVINQRIQDRLAGFLLLLATRWAKIAHLDEIEENRIRLRIPIRRSDLADFLGTRQESLSRAFHRLADDGYITIHTPYDIEIHDLQAFEDLAGGEDVVSPGLLSNMRMHQT